MGALYPILAGVAVLRLAELTLAGRNTRRLLARGGVEAGRGHYPLLVALHLAWLAAMAAFIDPDTPPRPIWLAVFAVLLAARGWVIASLGPFWTTRIITVPGEPLVARGPYRFLRHPNYLVVMGEIAVLPLAFGAWRIALAFSLANAALLAHRIRVENAALAGRSRPAATPPQRQSAWRP